MVNKQSNAKRNADIELLRIVSIIMVTTLHALGKGGLLQDMVSVSSANNYIAWILESLSISAVNVFMLISGYFLIKSSFKISKLINYIAQIIFYTAGSFAVCALLGIVGKEQMNIYWFLNYFLPIHMDVFWFMTVYLVIYILLPVLSKGIQHLDQKEHGMIIVILLVYECGFKSFLPFQLATDSKGYSFLWCLIVFLTGAYFRLYGFKVLNSSVKGWILYVLSCVAIFAETYVLRYVSGELGHLENISGMSMDYNNVFVFLSAVGLFAAFSKKKPMKEGIGKVICFLSPMTLGVYLFQENMTLRYMWQSWFKLGESQNAPMYLFIGRIVLAVLGMYVLGTIVDYLRIKLFEAAGKITAGSAKNRKV